MLGEVQYGGRVTDDFDKRLLNTFTNTYFSEPLLHGQFEYYKSYRAPMTRNLHIINEIINSLPNRDSPEVFGLHPNADITLEKIKLVLSNR
jgi:dynein heavy chain